MFKLGKITTRTNYITCYVTSTFCLKRAALVEQNVQASLSEYGSQHQIGIYVISALYIAYKTLTITIGEGT